MAKKKYHYLSALYNTVDKDGERKTSSMSFFCVSEDDKNPSGIPTMGFMLKKVHENCEKRGCTYEEGSFYIVSIIKLSKAQYDNLNDETIPED